MAETDPLLVLLPSPLLGAATWRPVADRLAARGWEVRCCPSPPTISTPGDVLAAQRAVLPVDRGLVLVAHSNAGLYVPSLTAEPGVLAAVFVDAGLPAEQGAVPLAPESMRTFLSRIVDVEGMLPPWTEWWDPAAVDALFPDLASRRAVEQEQSRLPLSYFQERLPVPDGWTRTPCAYVAFGDTYAEERGEAARRGWPVRTLPGGHLHMLRDPDAVAGAVVDVLQELGVDGASSTRRS